MFGSLFPDEIIKLEKRQKRFQQQNSGGGAGGRPASPSKGGVSGAAQPRGRGRPPGSKQQKKPFGLLNKSKAIGKKPNNPRARGPALAKANVAAALKSRLSGPGIDPKQQQLGKMQNLARIRRRRNNNPAANPPANKAFNKSVHSSESIYLVSVA